MMVHEATDTEERALCRKLGSENFDVHCLKYKLDIIIYLFIYLFITILAKK